LNLVYDKKNHFDSLRAGEFYGAISDLTNAEYHSLKAYWSSTQLKYLFSASPAHFYDKYFVRPHEPYKRSEAVILGSITHCTLLSPQDFHLEFMIAPKFEPKVKKTDPTIAEQKEAWFAANPGKEPITEEQRLKGEMIAGSVLRNPACEDLLKTARKELSLFWKCPFTRLNFKAKIDALNEDNFVELKTCRTASPHGFAKQMTNLNYDLSVAHYSQGIQNVLGKTMPAKFIAVETADPFVVQDYLFGDLFMQLGYMNWLEAVTKLENGISNGQWPAYFPLGESPVLDPPSWAMGKSDATAGEVEDDIF
jgi:hypothetical protein